MQTERTKDSDMYTLSVQRPSCPSRAADYDSLTQGRQGCGQSTGR